MKVRKFFISDLHIGHANILKFEPENRPFATIEEHDEFIVKQWNHYVGPNDIVYNLGDVGMKSTKDYMKSIYSRLNGTHILIRGNHDKYTDTSLYELGISAILQEAKIWLDKSTLVKLAHCPYIDTEFNFGAAGYRPAWEDKRPTDEGIWLCSGHTHGNTPKVDPEKKVINVSWDQWKKPVSVEELMQIIRSNSE